MTRPAHSWPVALAILLGAELAVCAVAWTALWLLGMVLWELAEVVYEVIR